VFPLDQGVLANALKSWHNSNMCGRFAITLPNDAMAQLFEAAPANDLPSVPNYNVCPTTQIHVVAGDAGRRLTAMRWGFLPGWYKTPTGGPLLINARAETIAGKPAFREACRHRRCLVPASGYFEWTKTPEGAREPWYITRTDGAPIVFAGVWQVWANAGAHIATCAIVTTAASETMSAIHHRMPVTLERDEWGLWLGEEGKGAARLMRPAPEDRFSFFRVGTAINSNRATGPALIKPLIRTGH
jgi:putative SOS response-associated peptidase YedK